MLKAVAVHQEGAMREGEAKAKEALDALQGSMQSSRFAQTALSLIRREEQLQRDRAALRLE